MLLNRFRTERGHCGACRRKSNQIKSNLFAEKEKKKQQDTKAGKPALTWAQQKGTIKQ